MKDLLEIREEIDAIDDQIVKLYEERMELAEEVAEYKILNHKPVFDKDREKNKLDALGAKTHSDFNRHGVRELFDQIMSMSRKKQYQLLTEHGIIQESQFSCIGELDFQSAKVVFQGVEGAYSQQAMQEYFGKDCDSFHVETWKDAMEAIKNGYADYAVLPIENSSTGGISANYDLLLNYKNAIVGQYVMRIDQCLLALPGTKPEQIKTVFSHPQGLLQSRQFMNEHPSYEGVEYGSTAAAARKVAEDNDHTQAAIASRRAAKEYGLEIVADSIQQEKNNCTRFIIIGRKEVYTEKSNKLALCIELPHQSGSLYRILSHFLYNDLNMTQIESRPIPGKNWEYRFFVDIEGNLDEASVQNALRGVKEEAAFMRVLGNFEA